MIKCRTSTVAGQFYPGSKKETEKQLDYFFSDLKLKQDSEAIISPHAGYIYSGKTAARAFSRIKKFGNYILLGPNHTGLGSSISIDDNDCWETPFGKIEVNRKIAEFIAGKSRAEFDHLAHIGEHSLEVQVPFIQYLFKNSKIVPIIISYDNLGMIEELANAIYEISKKESIGLIASSDFSHFLNEKLAKKLDSNAIESIKKLDAAGFHNLVNTQDLSICGYLPITALLYYCRQKGLKIVELEEYTNSGRVTRDYRNIVAYSAICFRNGKN